jgi:hypothetical protein
MHPPFSEPHRRHDSSNNNKCSQNTPGDCPAGGLFTRLEGLWLRLRFDLRLFRSRLGLRLFRSRIGLRLFRFGLRVGLGVRFGCG